MKRSCLGLTAVLFVVAFVSCSGAASAQPDPAVACTPPPPPPPQSLRPISPGPRPPLPPCITSHGNTLRCRRGEVDRYNLEIEAFNDRVDAWNKADRRYVDALNSWTDLVSRYSRCETNAANDRTFRGN